MTAQQRHDLEDLLKLLKWTAAGLFVGAGFTIWFWWGMFF